jgi:hypothetical protein
LWRIPLLCNTFTHVKTEILFTSLFGSENFLTTMMMMPTNNVLEKERMCERVETRGSIFEWLGVRRAVRNDVSEAKK